MNKLEVGMYVRTIKGIAKIIGQNDDVRFSYPSAYICDRYLEIYDDTEYLYEEDIIKSSYNIIDLIEYGDIVKYKIDDEKFISEVWGEKNNYFVQNFDVPIDLRDLNIVSIVTKEQFKAMEYRIGE